MDCEHKWSLSDGDFQQKIIARHLADDTNGNCYISKFMVHYWEETVCEKCGEKRLISGTFDRKDVEPISEDEFNAFNDFLTVLNQRTGNTETKKKLINYALDSMHWVHVPQFMLHNDDYNYFYFSVSGDPRDQKPEERFDWEFYDALDMINEMKKRDGIMGAVREAEKKRKENIAAGGNDLDYDIENFGKIMQGIIEALEKQEK